jgi:hypothetical protein
MRSGLLAWPARQVPSDVRRSGVPARLPSGPGAQALLAQRIRAVKHPSNGAAEPKVRPLSFYVAPRGGWRGSAPEPAVASLLVQAAASHNEGAMIRKLTSGQYRLYSRKKNPKTGRRRNLGTSPAARRRRSTSGRCSTSSGISLGRHSGLPRSGKSGIHSRRRGVMDSGLAAAWRPGMTRPLRWRVSFTKLPRKRERDRSKTTPPRRISFTFPPSGETTLLI